MPIEANDTSIQPVQYNTDRSAHGHFSKIIFLCQITKKDYKQADKKINNILKQIEKEVNKHENVEFGYEEK